MLDIAASHSEFGCLESRTKSSLARPGETVCFAIR
jgi:hypothetical protein